MQPTLHTRFLTGPPRSDSALPTQYSTTAIEGDHSQGNHLSEPKRCSDQPGHLCRTRYAISAWTRVYDEERERWTWFRMMRQSASFSSSFIVHRRIEDPPARDDTLSETEEPGVPKENVVDGPFVDISVEAGIAVPPRLLNASGDVVVGRRAPRSERQGQAPRARAS